ncbi:hypothetical protein LguiA_021729 [Lonicera macranthoides]
MEQKLSNRVQLARKAGPRNALAYYRGHQAFARLVEALGFILEVTRLSEICDRFAGTGFHANMITYLTQQSNLPLVKASNILTNFGCTVNFTPLIGALLVDSFAGRFWTIILARGLGYEGDGTWTPSTIPNLEYKGPWKQKEMKNPNYKGKWKAPKIDNLDFKDGPDLYVYPKLKYVGIELW